MSDNTVTISKKEYLELKREAQAYRKITSRVFESVVSDNPATVASDFRETGLYNEDFVQELEGGLKRSSYAKA